MSAAVAVWPTDICYHRSTAMLDVTFDSDECFSLPAEYLRVESPSAEVQGHGGGPKTIVAGKKSVTINRIEPVGRYAVRLVFSDGHDTGLYSWATLHRLGLEQALLWPTYLDALKRDGLVRG